ncbi:MAG: LptF/LptG family permease [Thermoguttaceae bacterium]|nr:LptF/LptG family permease [Thermoguttaceae bacterium]MDW8079592.1 LptF/LptG family permease [Thermoguttaceae bacterium]
MKIWTRHVLGELVKAFILAVGITTFFLVGVMGAREGLRNGLPPAVVVEILPYFLPEVLGITIPVCVLLSVSVVFSRLAGANEFLALAAAGIHPLRIAWNVLTWGTILSVITVGCYELSAMWGRPGMRRVIYRSLPRIALARLRLDKSLTTPYFSVVVREVEGNRLRDAVITIPGRGEQPEITISAEMVEILIDPDRGNLVLRCSRGDITAGEKSYGFFPDTIERVIPLEPASRPVNRHWLAMAEIPQAAEKLRAELARVLATELAAPAGSSEKAQAQRQRRELEQQLRRLVTEPIRRWANGFSCLGFALVGLAVAMRVHSENLLTGFFLCFTPVSVAYYPLLMFSDQITTLGYLPPIAIWCANLGLFLAGILLLRGVPV